MEPYAAGSQVDLSYRLIWGEEPQRTPMPRVINTAMGDNTFGEGRLAVIDFEPSELFDDPRGHHDLSSTRPMRKPPMVCCSAIPDTGGLRLAFSFEPGDRNHVELRAQLLKDKQPASEVWLYRWTI